jgi:sulfite exporter TauE/SafE
MASEFVLFLRFLHLVFLSWGVAGTTIANLSLRLEREPWLSLFRLEKGPWLPSILFPRLTRLVSLGLLGLILSGIGLTVWGDASLNWWILTLKHVVVAILIVDGLHLALRLEPKLVDMAKTPEDMERPEFEETMRKVKVAGLISLFSWYFITALSVFL